MTTGRWAKLARTRSKDVGTCWMWLGARDSQGYAKVRDGGRTDRLHHVLCREVHRPPRGRKWVARHVCGCKLCVNPAHIVPGTQRENSSDDRHHRRMRVKLPNLGAVRRLAAALPPASVQGLTDAEHRKTQRRRRLILDQTMRGGNGIAEIWFREMAGCVSHQIRDAGLAQGANDDDVLLLSLIARKKRELSGEVEPEHTGLSPAHADIAARAPHKEIAGSIGIAR